MAGYIEKFHVKCEHELQFNWPDGTVLVPHIRKNGLNFEIYLSSPNCYYSGWGETFKEAEAAGWNKYQGYINCKGHEFERKEYTNGVGFCKHCNLFKSGAFPPAFNCKICDIATNHCKDDDLNYYCEEHKHENKGKEYLEHLKFMEQFEHEDEPELTKEEFQIALAEVIEHLGKWTPSILNLEE